MLAVDSKLRSTSSATEVFRKLNWSIKAKYCPRHAVAVQLTVGFHWEADCGFSGAAVFAMLKVTWYWWKWFLSSWKTDADHSGQRCNLASDLQNLLGWNCCHERRARTGWKHCWSYWCYYEAKWSCVLALTGCWYLCRCWWCGFVKRKWKWKS